jgi:predicted DNA-binding transcriptional regulator AlpA
MAVTMAPPKKKSRQRETVVVPPEDQQVLLTRPQMAQLLGVSPSTLDRWSVIPGFPVIRGPRMVRFHRKTVLEYVDRMGLMQLQPANRAGLGNTAYPPKKDAEPPRKKGRK